ncbi:MAG: peptidoglycan recognition family protein [Phycisphaerae bacterium]
MRRLIVAASLFCGVGTACVSNDPAQPATRPYPIYKVNTPCEPSATREAQVHSIFRAPARYGTTWYPHSGRISLRWTHVVIHHSATASGGAKTFDRYHRESNGWDELGYHFVIGNGTDTPDGYVEVGTRWHKQKHGAHCKTESNYYNEHGIGICLVGNFNKTRPTQRQRASLQRLARFLCRECEIPPERVTTHAAITRKTQCPGRHFNPAALRRSLATSAAATSMP